MEVLGRTRILRDGVERDPGGARPLMVLALLVAADGARVDADVLADRLWRGVPPATARTTLQGHVARLRRVLDAGVPASEATVLTTVGGGYRLALPDDAVDVRRFAAACREAHRLHRDGDPSGAGRLLREALDLWGTPYAGVDDVDAVRPVLTRLEEEHARAVELLIKVRLDLGDPWVLPDVAAAAAADPLRESVQALHARALHAAGRQPEALEVLRRARERLVEELGLDPSPRLRDLELAILRRDESLAPRQDGGGPVTQRRPVADLLVGREGPLAELAAALDETRSGAPRVVVVTGEPGIGKSSLVAAFAAERRDAVDVVAARGLETAGVPPYWVWRQLLGGVPASAPDPGARFGLALDLARRLAERAAPGPLVVTLDDLQWVDEDSLHVLEVVLGQLTGPVLVVLLAREDGCDLPPVSRVLAAVARMPGSRRIGLAGLDAAEVTALARHIGGEWAGDAADLLHRRSGGNPFLATELARLGPSSTDVPAGVRDVLRVRLAGLPAQVVVAVEAVAVAGVDCPGGLLAEIVGVRPADADAAASAAVRAGLLRRVGGDELAVAHDLVREVVVDRLAPARRAALHGAVADALGRRPSGVAARAAVAVHRSEAALGARSPEAARACLVAAGDALDRAAFADATGLARRGLRSAGDDPGVEGDLERVLGVALRRLGLLEEGAEALGRAAGLARSSGDRERLCDVALAASGGGIGGYWGSMAAVVETDDALLSEAVAAAEAWAADDTGAADRGGGGASDGAVSRLAALLAAAAVHEAAVGRAGTDLADRALALAGDDPGLRARARVAAFVTRWTPAHAADRVGLAERMVAEAGPDGTYLATALHLQRCALLETGRLVESAAASRRYWELVERRGDGDHLLLDLWWRVGLALARGEHAEARALGDEAVASAPAVSPAAAALARSARQTVEGVIAWLERRMDRLVPPGVGPAPTPHPAWPTRLGHGPPPTGPGGRTWPWGRCAPATGPTT